MTFQSPLADLAQWTLTHEGRTLPADGRYPRRVAWGVRATRSAAAQVVAPARGVARILDDGAGGSVVELQPVPFLSRGVMCRLAMGLPTFEIALPGVAPSTLAPLGADVLAPGASLASVTDAWIGCIGQDEAGVDATSWSEALLTALRDAGGTTTGWQPFRDAVMAVTRRPVLVLDHRARPRQGGRFQITVGGSPHTVVLDPTDNGNLEAAVARANTAGTVPIASVFASGASSARVTELLSGAPEAPDFRWVRWEDGVTSSGDGEVTPTRRHLSAIDLHAWMAPQTVNLPAASPFAPNLQRYTSGNKVSSLIDGKAFFEDLVDKLHVVRDNGGGFHLAGWDLHHDFELRDPRPGEPDTPITLAALVQELSDRNRESRFLAVRFIQGLGSSALPAGALMTVTLFFQVVLALSSRGVRAVETDLAGGLVGFVTLAGATAYAIYVQAEDGLPLEPSRDAVDALEAIARAEASWDEYPAETSDNPLAAGVTTWLGPLNRFGVNHQKLAVVDHLGRLVAYAGGVDLNPNRVDDPNHVTPSPLHDVHVRVEGPAAEDMARTFDQRWRHIRGTTPAFTIQPQTSAGTDIVQVARTYFRTTDTSRAYPFAPNGDFTIRDTLLRAIASAREYIYIEDQYFTPPGVYRTALLDAITQRRVERVVIVLPTASDQPFGDLERREFVNALRAADTTGEIVRVGAPMPRPQAPEFERLAAGGKCYLHRDIPVGTGGSFEAIVLAPEAQVPDPPFWLAVDGELMLAVQAPIGSLPTPAAGTKPVNVLRSPSALRGSSVDHRAGAPVTVLNLSGIYVHAKMMIIDDVFVSVGSANLNRRGLAHDGEIVVFSVPEDLRRSRDNPARKLRLSLWGEHLGLPPLVADALLADPIASTRLFDRPWLAGGNRFVPIDFMPVDLVFNMPPGDNWVTFVLKAIFGATAMIDYPAIFNTVGDPTTSST